MPHLTVPGGGRKMKQLQVVVIVLSEDNVQVVFVDLSDIHNNPYLI